ncbi:MAG: hypothetical protein JWO13_1986 [Acidobacteriales bacterium]|nr:hypothetical protein [Terriglobales bacterium]
MADNRSPKHGSSPKTFPDRDKDNPPEDIASESQPDGTAAESPRGETQAQPKPGQNRVEPSGTGPTGDHPATAGHGHRRVRSETPENRTGQINPSAPTEATEGASTAEQHLPANPTMDSAGEVGEPSGKGNLDVDPETFEQAGGPNPTEKRPGKEGAGDLRKRA